MANHKSEALDNYITSMRALVDVISVGALETHACTKVGETYTEDDSAGMSYGSIFDDCFQTKLDQVGDGAITPTFAAERREGAARGANAKRL